MVQTQVQTQKLIIEYKGYEIEVKRLDVDEIDVELIKYLLEEIKKERKPCIEYETPVNIVYELCRDMLLPNRFTLNIYYGI